MKTQTRNLFIIVQQRLAVVTSHLRRGCDSGAAAHAQAGLRDLMEDHVLKDVRRHIFCILSSVKLFCLSWEEDTSGQSEVWAGEDTSGHSEVQGGGQKTEICT